MQKRLASLVAVGALAVAAAAAPTRAGSLSPDDLLARYQPVTVLDVREAFSPSSSDGFVERSTLQRLGEDGLYHPAEMPPPGLPVHGDGWRLDRAGCSPAGGHAAVGCYAAGVGGPSVVYGRFDVRGGTIVLQYWLFYEHNFWSLQYPPSDLVWQAHEGDWEVVSIVLDAKGEPVEAAYSQHCTGERRPWAAVPKAAGTDHPLVFVAAGSHANLFAPGIHAISLACYPPEAQAFFRANNVIPRDFNFPGESLGPGRTAVVRVHDNSPRWVRFPGTWGEAQFVRAPAPIGLVPFGTSPVGPAFQDDWLDPLGTIAGYPVG